ncbi:MAG: hypothetical protein COA43_03785 [Robiginitomaculum sp.]|nr:MAG: hypothetical protein COA43_03785 [Robiginitomaculum sp.]
MLNFLKKTLLVFMCICIGACTNNTQEQPVEFDNSIKNSDTEIVKIEVGAQKYESYLPLLKGKRVAVIANATSMVDGTHLVDALLNKDIKLVKVFAPEHGFRGDKDAGEKIYDEIDPQTGLPIISLYGANKKPSVKTMQDIDALVFDIQDVGVRFYTYLSTLHYVMEACAENSVPLILLDRPNPNGFYIDGPVLKPEFKSFIGLHPIPLIYGMTIGEYGLMINGENWLKNDVKCDLTVIKITGYTHDTLYELPIKPSPNLPNMNAVYLYPSLALFEGTVVSVGRGTEFPFQAIGHPDYPKGGFQFTPSPNAGAKYPKLNGQSIKGHDLRSKFTNAFPPPALPANEVSLDWLIDFYISLPDQENFFLENNFFNKLAGNNLLMRQIKDGQTQNQIRESWKDDLRIFKLIRQKYMLYD